MPEIDVIAPVARPGDIYGSKVEKFRISSMAPVKTSAIRKYVQVLAEKLAFLFPDVEVGHFVEVEVTSDDAEEHSLLARFHLRSEQERSQANIFSTYPSTDVGENGCCCGAGP